MTRKASSILCILQAFTPVILLGFILLFTYALYYPGLFSIFLLDDHQNLKGLENISSDNSWWRIITFSLNGISSSLGRPLSLFTFALQYNAWPLCPYCFKLVNLIIHLLNGILIYYLTKILATQSNSINSTFNINTFSLLVAFTWLIHPRIP